MRDSFFFSFFLRITSKKARSRRRTKINSRAILRHKYRPREQISSPIATVRKETQRKRFLLRLRNLQNVQSDLSVADALREFAREKRGNKPPASLPPWRRGKLDETQKSQSRVSFLLLLLLPPFWFSSFLFSCVAIVGGRGGLKSEENSRRHFRLLLFPLILSPFRKREQRHL